MERATILCFEEPPAEQLAGFDELHITVAVHRPPLTSDIDGAWCQQFVTRPFIALTFEWEWDYEGEAQGQEGSMNDVYRHLGEVACWYEAPQVRVAFERIDTNALRRAVSADEPDADRFLRCARAMSSASRERLSAFLRECYNVASNDSERALLMRGYSTLTNVGAR